MYASIVLVLLGQGDERLPPALRVERAARIIVIFCGVDLILPLTVNSLIIENSIPIENGDFERFLAFRLARIGIFL